jgi:hypothetical protein
MEDAPELNDTLPDEAEQEGDDTLIVPPPSFRERLRAAQSLCDRQPELLPQAQETPSAEDAAHSSKRR